MFGIETFFKTFLFLSVEFSSKFTYTTECAEIIYYKTFFIEIWIIIIIFMANVLSISISRSRSAFFAISSGKFFLKLVCNLSSDQWNLLFLSVPLFIFYLLDDINFVALVESFAFNHIIQGFLQSKHHILGTLVFNHLSFLLDFSFGIFIGTIFFVF